MHWHDMFNMNGWMWLFWLLVVAGVVLLIVWVARLGSKQDKQSDEQSPERILKQRFARGEIDQQEYEQKLRQLRL